MGWMQPKKIKVYCAFCKSPRKIRVKKHVGATEAMLSAGASMVLMFLFFQKFDFRILPFFALFICGFEFLIQIQYRLSLVCQECGFDPLVYMRSHAKACAQVQEHLANRKKDPMNIMSAVPNLDLPKAKKKSATQSRLDVRL